MEQLPLEPRKQKAAGPRKPVAKGTTPQKTTTSLGKQLKNARKSKGLTTGRVAKQLRWREVHIVDLEADKFENLPHGPYLKAFVQSYAALLEIPFAPLEKQLALQGGTPATVFAKLPEPIATSVLPTKQLVWATVIILAVVFVVGGVLLAGQQNITLEALNSSENALSLPAEEGVEILPPPTELN